MKSLFKILFYSLVFLSALTVELATLELIATQALLLTLLIFPAFYYEELKNYITKPQW